MSFFRIVLSQLKSVVRLILGMPVTFPSLGSMTLGLDDIAIAKSVIKKPQDWKNEKVISEYEQSFARWNGSRFAFSFMAGRVAFSACLYALQLKQGDEVLLPGYTCIVVANAINFAGLKPVYVDIELDTYGLDAERIEAQITPRSKAIVLHHLYGLVCRDYEKIIAIAKKHRLKVIEDCAHSTGAEFKNKKVGNWGDLAFYSSEQSKVFNTIQGGMAVTNSSKLSEKIDEYYQQCSFPSDALISRQLHNVILNYYKFSDPSRWWKGNIAEIFYGSQRVVSTTKQEELGIQPESYGQRMPAAIAKIGQNQLPKINEYNHQRRLTAKRWDEWCESRGHAKPLVIEQSTPVFLRYPVLVSESDKKDLSWALKELGFIPGVWFLSNLHPKPVHIDGCPSADKAVRRCINLPCLGIPHD